MLLMGVLALVLLVSQSLGLLHGIAHGSSSAVTPVAPQMPLARGDHQHDHQAEGLAGRLFSGHNSHGGAADCRLYDQSSHCDVMPGVPLVLVLPLVLAPRVLFNLAGLAVARWHALFQARGPPLVR